MKRFPVKCAALVSVALAAVACASDPRSQADGRPFPHVFRVDMIEIDDAVPARFQTEAQPSQSTYSTLTEFLQGHGKVDVQKHEIEHQYQPISDALLTLNPAGNVGKRLQPLLQAQGVEVHSAAVKYSDYGQGLPALRRYETQLAASVRSDTVLILERHVYVTTDDGRLHLELTASLYNNDMSSPVARRTFTYVSESVGGDTSDAKIANWLTNRRLASDVDKAIDSVTKEAAEQFSRPGG